MCNPLDYLQQNPIKHMDMIVPIKRGTARILYAGADGVLLQDTKSDAYMMSVTTHELGRKLLENLPKNGLFVCHQEFMLDDLKALSPNAEVLENYQVVYQGNPLPRSANLDFKPLNMADLALVTTNYTMDLGEEYISGRIADRELFGGYVNGEIIGFVGIHAEGSIGMLQVFDSKQGKGYGTALYACIINHQLSLGVVPFGQISVSNAQSMAIARKLGFEIGREKVWWLS
ncbi:MAG: GNAT family N-acetyltransferase [Defluviitaleaceae bacterium]|nr:GNAT family N-acetyltransferase [Defluviitaleaceae bacterium]